MLVDPRRTGYVAVALPEEMPVNETLELEDRLRDAVGLGLDAIVVNGVYPARFSGKEAETLRAAAAERARRRMRSRRVAGRAGRARARAGRSARTCAGSSARRGAPVHTLPFLFDAEVGLDEYATLAAKLGRDLG